MTKLLAITLFTAVLAACSSMSGSRTGMGNPAETKNSTDAAAAKTGNGAAVSPGGGAGAGGAAGSR